MIGSQFKLSDLAALSKEVSKVTEHENFDLKYVEEGVDFENIDTIEEALLSPGQQKYKAAKALISRLKAKDKSGQKLSPEDYKKLQNALTFVSQSDRAGAMKKSGGKTDGITKVREDVELEEAAGHEPAALHHDVTMKRGPKVKGHQSIEIHHKNSGMLGHVTVGKAGVHAVAYNDRGMAHSKTKHHGIPEAIERLHKEKGVTAKHKTKTNLDTTDIT